MKKKALIGGRQDEKKKNIWSENQKINLPQIFPDLRQL